MDLKERTQSSRRHPWEVARAGHVVALLEQTRALAPGSRVLDAGSGDSYVARRLLEVLPAVSITCWDAHYSDDDLLAPAPGITRVRDEPSGCFDLILALDVIEHVADDVAFLRGLRSHAAAGTTLVVTVPAYQKLFTSHDTFLGHYRRYGRAQLDSALTLSGWSADVLTGFFFSLLPFRAVSAATSGRRTVSADDDGARKHLGTWKGGRFLTSLVERTLAADAAAARAVARRTGACLPGLSLGAVARPASVSS